jgi:DNA-binding PadR family transcriptional regulator
LKKLEKRGLVERTGGATASPRESKPYRLTDTGRTMHVRETRRAVAVPEPHNPALLLGLANWPVLDRKAARAALADREIALAQAFKRTQSRRAAQMPLPTFVEAMFDYSLKMIAAGAVEGFRSILEDKDGKD